MVSFVSFPAYLLHDTPAVFRRLQLPAESQANDYCIFFVLNLYVTLPRFPSISGGFAPNKRLYFMNVSVFPIQNDSPGRVHRH